MSSRVRGWCPSLYEPMQTGDGLLVRVKPPAARLTPGQARALADAADRFGNGVVELTQRGNLQVRGLGADGVGRFAAAMVDAGLAEADPARERRRAVVPPPLLGDDPGMAPGTAALVARLEAACAAHPALAGLPGKFAIYVDGGGVLAGRPVAASMAVRADATFGPAMPDGSGGAAAAAPLAGPLAYPGADLMAFALAAPFGQLDAAMLRDAAGLAARHGTALRVTPWRALLLGRVPHGVAVDAGPRWIVDPGDKRLRVTSCVGAPGCGSGSTPTRADAARLASALPDGARLHVSGCAKGCAHPGPAPTLVGREGRYDLVRHGRAGDRPERLALTAEAALRVLAGAPP